MRSTAHVCLCVRGFLVFSPPLVSCFLSLSLSLGSHPLLAKDRQLNTYFSSLVTQILMNDNGLMGAALLTGMATFTILFPVARQGRLPYVAAVIDRFFRFLPAML